jgi:hypothetical protein
MRKWWRWRRELSALRYELWRVDRTSTLAKYEYQDLMTIYDDLPPSEKYRKPDLVDVMDRMSALTHEYLKLSDQIRRMEEVGPF